MIEYQHAWLISLEYKKWFEGNAAKCEWPSPLIFTELHCNLMNLLGAVVAGWTVGRHVERLILHIGHGLYQSSSPKFISLTQVVPV